MLVARTAVRARCRTVVVLHTSAKLLLVSSGADTASCRVVDAAASTLLRDAGCSRLASTRPIIFVDEASAGSSTEMIKALLAAGAGIYGLHSSVDCVQGPATPCDCKNRVILRVGEGYPAGWVEACSARVKGSSPRNGVGVPKYGVATTCNNYDLYPELFRPSDVKGGVRKSTKSGSKSTTSGKAKGERTGAFTPWPLLEEIMKGTDTGYPRVAKLMEVVFRHSDPLKTIIPQPEDTDAARDAKAHYKELLQAFVRNERVRVFDLERVPTPLTKQMAADKQPKGLVVAWEMTQAGAVVGPLQRDLGTGDREVILNEGQRTHLGVRRVCKAMASLNAEPLWTFSKYPEYNLLEHLGMLDQFRNFHAVVSVALGMNASGHHRNGKSKAPCPIATSMPKMMQLVDCDYDAVVVNPGITTYKHKAAVDCLKSSTDVDDPTATLQIMGMVVTAAYAVLKTRWPGIERWLRGEDVTPPPLRTGYTIWYNASAENRKYDAPLPDRPGFNPLMMKESAVQKRKRKAKDAATPAPLSRDFGAAPTAKFVLAGSGSGSFADPVDLSNSPSPPKRSRVEALDELE